MDKQIGFNRNILLLWLDAAAGFCVEIDDPAEVRKRLEMVVRQDIQSAENRRKTIDILLKIWSKSGTVDPELHAAAVRYFRSSAQSADRIWLHYGLTILSYRFFRETAAVIGQLSRLDEVIRSGVVRRRLVASRGQLGSLGKAVERVIFSMRDWRLLADADRRHSYVAQRQSLRASSTDVESWLLECTLRAHPAEEVPFADLLRLPELFAFRFTLTLDHLRQCPHFAVHRQGAWDMVRLADQRKLGPVSHGESPSDPWPRLAAGRRSQPT